MMACSNAAVEPKADSAGLNATPPLSASATAASEHGEHGLPIKPLAAQDDDDATPEGADVGAEHAANLSDVVTKVQAKAPKPKGETGGTKEVADRQYTHSSGSDNNGAHVKHTPPSAQASGSAALSPARPASKAATTGLESTSPSRRGSETLGQSSTQVELAKAKPQDEAPDVPSYARLVVMAAETTHLKPAHSQDLSASSTANATGVSEFSHQQLSMQPEAQDEKENADEGWQEMPAYARYDMYDDNDRLIAREHTEEEADDETYGYAGLGGAGKGYTRVIMDEDAESATSMDDNTQYLFKNPNGTSALGGGEEGRDAVSQMQATKGLLTEGQRIAYVGVARLEIFGLVRETEALEMTKNSKKQVSVSAEAMKMWGQKMMIRLYAHMDISVAEQVMIEQLAEHGVMPRDLTPALLTNSRVQNPLAEDTRVGRGSGPGTPKAGSPPPYEEEEAAEVPPPYEAHSAEDMPEVKTPSQLPNTDKIDIDLRWTVLCDLFLVLIADSVYDARSRVLLERVGKSLDLTWIEICKFEKKVTDALEMQQAAEKENWNEEEHMENRRKLGLKKRYIMMGLATVGGGLVIGLSAGLLAPVIGAGLAAGFTTIGVTGTSSFLAGAGGAALITSGAAASGSIIGGKAANRRTGAVKTFEYRPLHNNKRVNLIVTVSGWLTGKMDDVRLPFSTIDPIMGDVYSVLWEPEMLRSMGDTINILATEALTQGLQQVLGSTVLVSLMAAIQLPVVLTKLSYLIDNPWAVSLDRATAAGLILADSLIERSLGTRPITLVGYSIGSRVIFSCLKELAKKGAYGVVQNVYLFGSPVVVKKDEYLRARTVVSGRFVNGYNRNDWILGYLFRLTNGGIRRVAGLAPIEDCPWIENVEVTDLVPGHMQYRTAMPLLLLRCGWTVTSEEFSEIEDPDPENHEELQRELINEIEGARKELENEGKAKRGSKFGLFGRRKKDKQEWEIYEDAAREGGKQDGDRLEDRKGNNYGVLFDIDAIRAELAKEAQNDGTEELQVKEIESTLPPMKLDISPTRTASLGHRESLRETRSAEVLPTHSANENRGSRGLPATLRTMGAPSSSSSSAAYHDGSEPRGDEVQMTFDTSFGEPKRQKPAMDEDPSRPAMRTARTVPNMALADPWYDPDEEEEDFGQEKEISMTFA